MPRTTHYLSHLTSDEIRNKTVLFPQAEKAAINTAILKRQLSVDMDERQIYALALQRLRNNFKNVINRPNEWMSALGWTVSVPSQYLEYAKGKRPLALLLGYYSVLCLPCP